jgi:hypothetical protein
MDPNITNETYFDDDLPLSEPHFDEEATLLSAQPVVALTDIEAKSRVRKRLAFGVAMFFSIIAGALGATFIYKYKNQRDAAIVVKTAVPGVNALTASQGLPVATADADRAGPVSISRSVPAAEVDQNKPARVKAAKRTIDDQSQTELRRQPEDAKQLRRRQEREAVQDPRRRRHKSDDLARIREIFEGSQP